MARHKNANWNVPDKPLSWAEVNAAILMDIRDELRALNRIFAGGNFLAVPSKLDRIRAAVERSDRRLSKTHKLKAR